MSKHLPDERLWSRAEGEGLAEEEREHLGACPACRERLRAAEEGLGLAQEAGFVPEPSPAYWQAFRRQVEHRIDEEPAPSWAASMGLLLRPRLLVPVGAAALALVLLPTWRPGSTPSTGGPNLPAWEALPAANDDGSLDVLRGLALSSDAFEEAATCRDLADCLGALTDEESRILADALKTRLPEGRS